MRTDAGFVSSLKACAEKKDLLTGNKLHVDIIRHGLIQKPYLASSLISMYAKCGIISKAQQIHDEFQARNVVTWNAMITGYARHGQALEALNCYGRMKNEGIFPNHVTFICILKACGIIGAIDKGKQIHSKVVISIKDSMEKDLVIIGSALVDMYVKCGLIAIAQKVHNDLRVRNVVTWSILIAGYVQQGKGHEALNSYEKMRSEGILPDAITFTCILKACGNIGDAHGGRLVHGIAIETGVSTDTLLGSTIVGFYIKSGFLDESRKVFDGITRRDALLWGVIIAGYVQHGFCLAAIGLYIKMLGENVVPNEVIFAHTLKACAGMGATKEGKLIHSQIFESNLESDLLVGNSIIEVYVRFGLMDEAFKVFEKLSFRDVLSWSTIIEGCALHGEYLLVHQFLQELQRQGLKPDEYVLTHMLTACVQAGDPDEGIHYFKYMREYYGVEPNSEHYSCMVDLLGRAGHLHDAKDLLYSIPYHSPFIMWTSLLTSCRAHGNPQIGMQCFDNMMQLEPFDPSGHMLISNLLVEAGYQNVFDGIQIIETAKLAAM